MSSHSRMFEKTFLDIADQLAQRKSASDLLPDIAAAVRKSRKDLHMPKESGVPVIKIVLLVIALASVGWVFVYTRKHNAEIDAFLARDPGGSGLPTDPGSTTGSQSNQPQLSIEGQVENEMQRLRSKLDKERNDVLSKYDAQLKGAPPEKLEESKALRRTFNRSIAGQYSRKQIHIVVQAMRKMLGGSPGDHLADVIATDENSASQPTLSWRVHLLPYIGEKKLYDQFHLDEPWDSEHNVTLVEKMPSIYRGYYGKPDLTKTRLMTLDMPGGIGRNGRLFPLNLVRDKHAETLAIIIAGTRHAVPWTSPNDFSVTADSFSNSMKFVPKPTYWIGTVEGAALRVRYDGSFDVFRSLMTIDGGEPNALDAMNQETAQLMKAE